MIDAKVHTPSGAMEECYITELDNGEHTHTPHIHVQVTLEQLFIVFIVLESILFLNTLCVSADKHAIRFIPRENGVHSIDVRFNGSHIPGSPFKIRVGEPGQVGDPGMVSASGPGLEGGTTGK